MYGIQRIHLLRNVMILAGAGVGGGSLNYANTLYVPPEPFFKDRQWSHITDWRAELMPHYQQAQRMLGVVHNPTLTDADRIVKEVADEIGCQRHLGAHPGGCVLWAQRAAGTRQTGARPILRRGGPGAHRMPRMRVVHDRLSLRR
jgi:cholesterol oxidase